MKSALSYDKVTVFVGDTVYQMAINKGDSTLFPYVIENIEDDLLTLSLKINNKEQIKTKSEHVHSNPVKLAEIYLDKRLEFYHKFLPNEINNLIQIIEENGGTVAPSIKSRFAPLTSTEPI